MVANIPSILILTAQCAALSTLICLIAGVPIAYLLARKPFRGKTLVSSLTTLPMVIPPTAVGYLCLLALSQDGGLGKYFNLLFTWKAVVIAGTVLSMPLVVRTARVAFEAVDPRLETMARTLGHSPLRVFVNYTLPLSYRGLIAAALLGFTRAVGEFGATITIAGNIPGKTQTLASAIFGAQQRGRDGEALWLVCIAIVLGFIAVAVSEMLSRKPGGLR